jgi:hypothetical protein
MGAKRNAATAVNADKRLSAGIKIDSIHRAGPGALPASNAKPFFYHNPSSLALGISARGTGLSAGGRVTGQASFGLKTCGKATGRNDADACRVPGQMLVHESRAGKRAGVAADATLHSGSSENFHKRTPIK